MASAGDTSYSIRKRTRCPNCWSEFATEDVLWIAEGADLYGDSRLGDEYKERFLPHRFDANGFAIDRGGFSCRKLACPHCHLPIPRSYFETKTFFFSVAGAPSCGKSYFLTSAVWRLRRLFSEAFDVVFTDSDADLNAKLIANETAQFLSGDGRSVPKLEKTREQGDGYREALINHQRTRYLQPYLFTATPTDVGRGSGTSIVLYDNAGESFLPSAGADDASAPVTRHLGRSDALIFIYDPTQDLRFKEICGEDGNGGANEESWSSFGASAPDSGSVARGTNARQELVFAEVTKRVRENLGLNFRAKYPKSTIVVLSKFDVWANALPNVWKRAPWARTSDGRPVFLERTVREVSETTRALLTRYLPDVVVAAENFAADVVYIPTSATGESPYFDSSLGEWRFDAKNFRAVGVETPFLYALARAGSNLIPFIKR